MNTVEIRDSFKRGAIFSIIIFISCLLALLIIINSLFQNFVFTILVGLAEIIIFFISFRFRNKKIYRLGIGAYILSFRESEILISDALIKVMVQEHPYFLIFWNEFDVIKIKKRKIKWFQRKRISQLKKFEVEFRFYSYYPNYQKDMKYITNLMLSSRHFTEKNLFRIIDALHIFASELNKSYLIS